jgi:hypothetical protein
MQLQRAQLWLVRRTLRQRQRHHQQQQQQQQQQQLHPHLQQRQQRQQQQGWVGRGLLQHRWRQQLHSRQAVAALQ